LNACSGNAWQGSTAVRYRRDFAVERYLPSLVIKSASGRLYSLNDASLKIVQMRSGVSAHTVAWDHLAVDFFSSIAISRQVINSVWVGSKLIIERTQVVRSASEQFGHSAIQMCDFALRGTFPSPTFSVSRRTRSRTTRRKTLDDLEWT
jgi:hypothetical protein